MKQRNNAPMGKAHFGLIGLGVMGENLVLNAERNGFSSVVYNRTYAKTEEFLAGRGAGKDIVGAATLAEFVAAEAIGPEAPRTLILAPRESSVGYTLINGSGPQLGDGSVAPPAEDWLRLDRLVSGLVSGRGGDEVFGLADYAVRYVIVQTDGPLAQTVTRTLDAAPGLRRVAGQDGEVLWRVQGDTSRVRLVTDDDVEPLPVSSLTDADPFVEASALAGPATIALAQTADSVWQAELDGALLAAESVDGLQTFSVPAGGDATVLMTADNSDRSRWLWIQLIAVAVVIVLALPGRRLRDDDDVADDQVDEDDVEVLAADGIEVTS